MADLAHMPDPVERAAFELYADEWDDDRGPVTDAYALENWPRMSTHERATWMDKAARVLRAAGVDPQLLRWCDWPTGCIASYDASTGPSGGGWKHTRGGAVLLCPEHSPTVHWPRYEMNPDDRTYLTAHCGCGESAEVRPSSWEAVQAWWSGHVTAKEARRG